MEADFGEDVIEGAVEEEDFEVGARIGIWLERSLHVGVLAGQFGIRPEVAGSSGVGSENPFGVGGLGCDKRRIGAAGFVVPSEAVLFFFDALAINGPGVGDAVAIGEPLVKRHGEAGRSFRSEEIEAFEMVDVSALEADVAEIGSDHAGIGDGFNKFVVGVRAIYKAIVKTDSVGFKRGSSDEVNVALQIHFIFEGLGADTPNGMSGLLAGIEDVEMYGVGFALLESGDVLREQNEDSRVGSRLAGQKDFQCGKRILL